MSLGTTQLPLWRRLKQKARLRRRLRQWTSVRYNIALLRYRMPRAVSRVYESYAQHPESKHIVSRLDAAVIYNLVRRRRPGHCIELGSGLGTVTAIVALGMEANGEGRVTSLEQMDWMAKLAKELLPDACKERVEIVRCEPEVRQYFGEEWACYRFTPATADIDLVIIDGPGAWVDEAGNLVHKPNGDLVGLLPYLRPGCRVFLDGRLSTVAAYRRHLGDCLAIHQSSLGYTLMELTGPSPTVRYPSIHHV